VARKFIANGYTKVYALKGGWREWYEAKYLIEAK
jgi:3-mercaptopyruvate sulfurtransferase SseA